MRSLKGFAEVTACFRETTSTGLDLVVLAFDESPVAVEEGDFDVKGLTIKMARDRAAGKVEGVFEITDRDLDELHQFRRNRLVLVEEEEVHLGTLKVALQKVLETETQIDDLLSGSNLAVQLMGSADQNDR